MDDKRFCFRQIGSRTIFLYLRLKKLGQGIENGHVTGLIGDVGALATVFCMMRLHLHSVNGGDVPPKH